MCGQTAYELTVEFVVIEQIVVSIIDRIWIIGAKYEVSDGNHSQPHFEGPLHVHRLPVQQLRHDLLLCGRLTRDYPCLVQRTVHLSRLFNEYHIYLLVKCSQKPLTDRTLIFVWTSIHMRLMANSANSSASFGKGSGIGKGLAFLNLVIQYVIRAHLRHGDEYLLNISIINVSISLSGIMPTRPHTHTQPTNQLDI